MTLERKHYIDNLRWLCIILLIPYHIAMAWNCWGEANYVWFEKNRILSSFVTFVSPWYMALLFVLAGVSARFALRKKTNKEFVKERILKLFLPLMAGMCSVVALMAYYADKFHNGYQGGFLAHYKVFFTKFTELTGYDGGWSPGHLWFLLYLFVISMISLVLIGLQKRFAPQFNLGKMNFGGLACLVFLLPLAYIVLNVGGKSVGLYMLLYLIGFYIIAEESMMEKIVKYRRICLIVFLVSDVTDVYLFLWADHANEILNTIAMFFTCWFGILALLGGAKTHFNQNNSITRYLTKRSFLIYIFHYVWVVLFLYYFGKIWDDTILLVVSTLFGSVVMTIATCEIVRRIPVIRFIFGGGKTG